MVGVREVLFHHRNREVCSLSTQRAEQRKIRSWALIGPENREVKACVWESEEAPRKIRSTQVKRHFGSPK